jgi:hypothetical protein
MPRVPKAKIQRAHKLADELLAIWQQDIRGWARENWHEEEVDSVDWVLLRATNFLRQVRISVEGGQDDIHPTRTGRTQDPEI